MKHIFNESGSIRTELVTMVNDRRKRHRFDFGGWVNLTFMNDRYDCCQVRDVSLSGLSVFGYFDKSTSGNCVIELFQNETAAAARVNALAEVVWCGHLGIGLKFTEMTFDNYVALMIDLIDTTNKPSVVTRDFSKGCPFLLR